MLKYTFYYPEGMIRNVDAFFDHNYEDEWFSDPFVREMIRVVDNSEVISSKAVNSPIFGVMPVTKISGGVKALILLLKQDKPIWSPACGDNCTDFIIRIGEMKDCLIYVGHYLRFHRDFMAECIDNGQIIGSVEEFEDTAVKHFILEEI